MLEKGSSGRRKHFQPSFKTLLVLAIIIKILYICKLLRMNIMDIVGREYCVNKISGFPDLKVKRFAPKFKNPCWFQEDGMFRCLPYFFIAGVGKCGTTDLYEKLAIHPDVVSASIKEPNWLTVKRFGKNNESKFSQRSFDDYLEFFDEPASIILKSAKRGYVNKITVDGSGSTLVFNNHWWRFQENCGELEPKFTIAHYVHNLLPDAKIIVIMRDPTERLYSDYLYFNDNTSADLFHEEVLKSTITFNDCLLSQTLRACVYSGLVQNGSKAHLHFGLYYVFLKDWFQVFSRQQFHLIRFEDYIQNRLAAMKAIYRFLGVRPLTKKEERLLTKDKTSANSNSETKNLTGPMRVDTRSLVDDFYRQYNDQLVKLLGEKFSWK